MNFQDKTHDLLYKFYYKDLAKYEQNVKKYTLF